MSDTAIRVDAPEEQRVTKPRAAQNKAEQLFHEIEARRLIRPCIRASQLNGEIYELAKEMYGITTYWHKRSVRAGRNTLAPYAENPPDLMIGEDDILFLDLGPVFKDWEADFGRTFVTGSDPRKIKLPDDICTAFADGKRYFEQTRDIKASQLFEYSVSLARKYGWEFGGPIAGHLVGQFPHENISGDKVTLYIHPDSHLPMRSLNEKGEKRHWILEIHFVDREHGIGGFFEELLTIDSGLEAKSQIRQLRFVESTMGRDSIGRMLAVVNIKMSYHGNCKSLLVTNNSLIRDLKFPVYFDR